MQRQTIKNICNSLIALPVTFLTISLLPISGLNAAKAAPLNLEPVLLPETGSIKKETPLANQETGKSYSDKNFSVWLPGVANAAKNGHLSSINDFTNTYYSTFYQDMEFLEGILPLPNSVISETLESIVPALSNSQKFQITSKQSIKKGDVLGIEFTALYPEGYKAKYQVFLKGKRMYMLVAMTAKSELGSEADRFFNSLTFR